jgi:Putative auto-transporter adhesin, head GIN domain
MDNTIFIESNVAGPFTVDAKGIRSDSPVPIESDSWDPENRVLTLKGANDGVFIGGSCFIMGNVTFNGRTVSSGYNPTKNNKSYTRSWEDLGITEPKLSGFTVNGSGTYKISIPLDEQCDFSVNGSGKVKIQGDHNTNLAINVNGSGSASGTGTISKVYAKVNGSGSISGFKATHMASGKVNGSGQVHLSRHPGCKKSAHVSGSGDVEIE